MSVQIVLDVTNEFNSGSESGFPGLVKLDTGGYDYAVVQFISPSGTIAFKHTNDSGDIQGVSDGSAISSDNEQSVQGINLATGAAATSTGASSLFRFQSNGRYLWLDGSATPASVTKLLVRLYKIH
tara:strand:- start:2930 stop:3307 length:378 start_codon:yes stop_codon:yes gene_type:complete